MITAIFMKTILTIVGQKGLYYFLYLQGRKKAQSLSLSILCTEGKVSVTVLLLTRTFKFLFIVGCAAYFPSNMRVLHTQDVLQRGHGYETVEKKIILWLPLVTN